MTLPNPTDPPGASGFPSMEPAPSAPSASSAAAQALSASANQATAQQSLERVVADLIRERRAERRWRSVFRLLWLLVFVLLVWSFLPHRGMSSAPVGPHTAVVEVRGEIALESEANADLLMSALREAFEAPDSQAVVLRINSPGGSPVQAGLVNDEIERLKALHRKKVYAVVEEVCASGAYYIAVAADEIYVDKASLVGSIGVLMDGFGFTGLMDKVGVERRLITAGQHKGMLDPYSPQSPQERAYAQAMIDQIHKQFISVVREGRGDRLKETPETFSGLFWNGEEAVRLGLADATGSLDQVARDVVKAPDLIDYTPRENVAERLAKRFGAASAQALVRALREAPALR